MTMDVNQKLKKKKEEKKGGGEGSIMWHDWVASGILIKVQLEMDGISSKFSEWYDLHYIDEKSFEALST